MRVVRKETAQIEATLLTETNAKEVLEWILSIDPNEYAVIEGNTIVVGDNDVIAHPDDYIVYEGNIFDVYWPDDFHEAFKEVE